ncbi:LLM class flavin-dependent oxidoreductase [Flavobacterium degerlachei]|jgi:luciferase family oxidoreductase group 1|uniref:Luciferase-like monooxygenase n=1 Tax=Flavobacterium degerlachei TaxID=229203 RepID=A0A1H3A0T9_9FLAO|nr:LLM class flavin-dependent oxidoreductase [Flavobacterium degerlachei]SDX23245.1 luciferase family oxidoreductase, group 1 [Flavobacterium degerlachei]
MKNNFNSIPLSILDLALVLEGKTPAQSFKNSLSLAQEAENLGYHRFWLAEHHNMVSIASSATSILIGHIAGGTSKIRVGSGGIMLPNHTPLVIAEQFGTLASLYPGRIDLGLGRAPGTDQHTARALQRDDQAAFEFPKTVRELQQYLSEDNKNSEVRAIPGEGLDIPIWILGSSTESAKLAASFGLPYAFASHFAPQQLHQALKIYRSNFKPSEHLKKPYVIACVNVTAAATTDEAKLIATSMEKIFLGILTNDRHPLQPADSSFKASPEAQQVMKQFLTYSFIGNPLEIKEALTQFVDDTQIDELMVVSHIYDHQARLNSYKILKRLQSST